MRVRQGSKWPWVKNACATRICGFIPPGVKNFPNKNIQRTSYLILRFSLASRAHESLKMASRSPGGLEWTVSIKPLLIAPNASLDAGTLPKFCKSITLRYIIYNVMQRESKIGIHRWLAETSLRHRCELRCNRLI